MSITSLPEPGRLVEVGDRSFLVTHVPKNEPSEGPVPQGSGGSVHRVKLLSLEEDAFGEVEEVIWENEPGIRTRKKPGLPNLSSKSDPNGCAAILNALGWGVVDFVRQDLGEVEPFIANEVDKALLDGRLDIDNYWAGKEIGPAGGVIDSKGEVEDHIRQLKRRLKESRAYIDATPGHLELVVAEALDLAGQPPLEPATLGGEPIDPEVWSEELIFRMPEFSGSWAGCAEGLEHPQTGKVRPITFDHETAAGENGVVLCHLNHPLVRMSRNMLIAEIRAGKEKQGVSKLQIRAVDDCTGDKMAIVHALLLVTGETGQLLHQELIRCGVENSGLQDQPEAMTSRRIENANFLGADGSEILEAQGWFAKRWNGPDGFETALTAALDAEVEKRMKSIQGMLMKRRKEELGDQIKPLRKRAETIRKEIKDQFPDRGGAKVEENGRREKDLAALRDRLEAVELEAARGSKEIKGRYNDPQAWVFPASLALTFPRDISRMF